MQGSEFNLNPARRETSVFQCGQEVFTVESSGFRGGVRDEGVRLRVWWESDNAIAGLIFKAHRPLYRSNLGSRVIKKK